MGNYMPEDLFISRALVDATGALPRDNSQTWLGNKTVPVPVTAICQPTDYIIMECH